MALRMFEAFVQILFIVNLSLNQSLLTFLLCVRKTWMTHFDNFSVRIYLPLIWKDSVTHIHGLAVYVKEGLPFAWDLYLENSAHSYMFSTGFTSLSVLLLFPLSIPFFIFMHSFWFCFIQHRWGSLDQPIC